MNTIKVSIIVPIYNVEQYLARCLDSVAEQSYTNIEVILVDDGSTDGSAIIAQRYTEKYPNIILIKQINLGQGGARNTGLKYATGDYIAMLDSDDWLHKDYAKILVEEALKYDADVVECNGIQIWENGATKRRFNHIFVKRIINDSDKEDYLKKCSYVVWNKLFKKSLIDGYQFPEHMTNEDYAWTPIILSKARIIVQISNVLYFYFWRDNSATNLKRVNFDILKAQSILESVSGFRKEYSDVLQYYYVRNVLNYLLWDLSKNYSKKNEVRKILTHARKEYPDIFSDLHILGKVKTVWARNILDNNFLISLLIARTYQFLIDCGRMALCIYRNYVSKHNSFY